MITPLNIIKISSFPIFGIFLNLMLPATVVHFFKRGVFNFNKFFFSGCPVLIFKVLIQYKSIFLFNFSHLFLKNISNNFNLRCNKFQTIFSRAFSNTKVVHKKPDQTVTSEVLTGAVFFVKCSEHMRGKFYPRNLILAEIFSSDINLVYIEESYTLLEDFYKRKTYYFCLRESLLGEDFNLKVKVVDSKGREYLVKSQDLNNDFLKNSRNYVRYWDPSYPPVRFFLVLKKHLMPLEHVFPVGTPTMILRRVMVGPYPEIRVETAHAIPHLCGGNEYMSLRDSISKQFYVVKKSKVTLIPKN